MNEEVEAIIKRAMTLLNSLGVKDLSEHLSIQLPPSPFVEAIQCVDALLTIVREQQAALEAAQAEVARLKTDSITCLCAPGDEQPYINNEGLAYCSRCGKPLD